MSISKDIIKQCLMNKQREIDEAEIINRPIEFEPNGNYVIVGVRHAGKSYMLYQRVRQLQAEGKGWDEILFIPNRSLAPILFSNIKILSCPPQSQERLSLVHVSHKT